MRFRLLGTTAALALGAAACGSSDNGPTFASAADSATIAELAGNAHELVLTTFESSFGSGQPSTPIPEGAASPSKEALPFIVFQRILAMVGAHRGTTLPGLSTPPALVAGASSCVPVETGVGEGGPLDDDADGIPNDHKVNYGSACTTEDSAGTYRLVFSGFIEEQDVDSGFYGFSLTVGHFKIVQTDLTTGDNSVVYLNGTETFDAATALAQHAMSWSTGGSTHTSGVPDVAWSISAAETSTFAPDEGSNLALGVPLPKGVLGFTTDLRATGASGVTSENANVHIVLDTPSPLHYDPGCAGAGIDAGQLRGLLNGESTVGFTTTWSACGTAVLDIFGDTPATVAVR